MLDIRFLPWCKWVLCSSGMLYHIDYFWCFRTTVCPKFKHQAVQAWLSDLGLHISTDLTSWSVKYKICTYKYLFVFLALQPFWLYFLLPHSGLYPPHSWGFFIMHNDTLQSVGLLWTNNQAVAETSTWQHTTLTTDHAPSGIGTHIMYYHVLKETNFKIALTLHLQSWRTGIKQINIWNLTRCVTSNKKVLI
jgi:hypothetical protein